MPLPISAVSFLCPIGWLRVYMTTCLFVWTGGMLWHPPRCLSWHCRHVYVDHKTSSLYALDRFSAVFLAFARPTCGPRATTLTARLRMNTTDVNISPTICGKRSDHDPPPYLPGFASAWSGKLGTDTLSFLSRF